jgi:adenylate kinase family enzyme
MDGNYGNTYDVRMPAADSLIWLDYPRRLCVWRVLVRQLTQYGQTRPDMAPGCPERIDMAFLRFVWNFPGRGRARIVDGIAKFGGDLRVIRFANDREAEAFLASAGAA